jgi:hypothetical protein
LSGRRVKRLDGLHDMSDNLPRQIEYCGAPI